MTQYSIQDRTCLDHYLHTHSLELYAHEFPCLSLQYLVQVHSILQTEYDSYRQDLPMSSTHQEDHQSIVQSSLR